MRRRNRPFAEERDIALFGEMAHSNEPARVLPELPPDHGQRNDLETIREATDTVLKSRVTC
jgi:hypothetical protein